MKVSICCAYFNRAETIPASLESLLNQDFDSYEIIIVNDGSTDPEVEKILNSYTDPRLKVIHQANEGFVSAIRRAVENSEGEYIAIHGAGDISYPGRLKFQSEFLDNNLDYTVVSANYRNIIVGGLNDAFVSLRNGIIGDVEPDFLVKNSNPFSHGEVMFRKCDYDSVGGYRVLFRFAQDKDLWLRLSFYGKLHKLDLILYDRMIFNSDGVSSDRKKLELQALLSCFAVQCYLERRDLGFDSLDKFGPVAFLLRKKGRNISNFYFKQAVELIFCGDVKSSYLCLKKSINEMIGFKNIFLIVFFPIFRLKVFRLAFVRLMSKSSRTKRWVRSEPS